MKPIAQKSLCSVLDDISAKLFFGQDIDTDERQSIAKWIATRQGLPGSYAGMFAPTELDRRGIRLFTGEAVRSRAGIGHHLGEESCRVLSALGVKDKEVKAALDRAVAGMSARLDESEHQGGAIGLYCCGTCSAGYWRNLACSRFPRAEERLQKGLDHLKQNRASDGKWRRFPFYYTSLALIEIGPDLAKAELQYAAKHWDMILPKLSRTKNSFAQRRAAVGQRLLGIS